MKLEKVVPARLSLDRERRLSDRNWLGIPAAGLAIITNLRFFFTPLPSTPLRVLSLIAMSALLRSRGGVLGPERRRAVIEAMELGALLNDRFDGDAYDPDRLRESVAWFARSEVREVVWNYAKRLRHLERIRPTSNESGEVVRLYREDVNRVSLELLWALTTKQSLAKAGSEIERARDLRYLFQMIMLFQVIDDVLDRRKDQLRGLPSLATVVDSNSTWLLEQVLFYQGSTRVRLDPDFCLHVALKVIAASARLVIRMRAGLKRSRACALS